MELTKNEYNGLIAATVKYGLLKKVVTRTDTSYVNKDLLMAIIGEEDNDGTEEAETGTV